MELNLKKRPSYKREKTALGIHRVSNGKMSFNDRIAYFLAMPKNLIAL